MSYTRNFELRRAAPTLERNGSFKTPSGSALVLGTVVQMDESNAGLLKQAASGATLVPTMGILWFEHIQYQGVDPNLVLYVDRNTAPANAYAQIISGKGVKVTYKNTPAVTLPDGRTRAAVTMVNTTGIGVGKYLSVSANGQLVVSATANNAAPAATDVMRVVAFDTSVAGSETVDAELLA